MRIGKKVLRGSALLLIAAFVFMTGCDNLNNPDDDFVAVTDITGVPVSGVAGSPVNASGAAVAPENATNKTIVWSIEDAGTTEATADEAGVITPKAAGTLKLKATIVNGAGQGTDYDKIFSITIIAVPVAPGAPTLTPADSQLAVSWTAVAGAVFYEVWHHTENTSGAATKLDTDPVETTAAIAGLTNGTKYYVWITAKNSAGTSRFSPAASGTPAAPVPEAPSAAPTVTAGDGQLVVEWTAVNGATSYEVWHHTENTSEGATKLDTDPAETTAAITGLANGTTCYVWIKAKNSAGTSGFSPSATGTPVASVPVPEAPAAAPDVTAGDGQLVVKWTAVDGATSYEVWHNTTNTSEGATKLAAEPDGTTAAITGLTNGTKYYVWIKAKNSAGSSGFSPSASGTPAPAIIVEGLQITVTLTGDTSFILPIRQEIVLSESAPLHIDWGDGVQETKTAAPYGSNYPGFSHTYAGPGEKTITLTGSCYTNTSAYVGKCAFGFNGSASLGYNAAANRAKITKASGRITALTQSSDLKEYAYYQLFYNCTNLSDITGLVFSETNSGGHSFLKAAFQNTKLVSVPDGFLSNLGGAQGNSFLDSAFYGCSSLASLPAGFLSGLAGKQGANFLNYTFKNCTSLASVPAGFLSGLTGSQGDYFLYEAFSGCTKLNAIDLFGDGNPVPAGSTGFMTNAMSSVAGAAGTKLVLRIHGTEMLSPNTAALGLADGNVLQIQVASNWVGAYKADETRWNGIADDKFVALE